MCPGQLLQMVHCLQFMRNDIEDLEYTALVTPTVINCSVDDFTGAWAKHIQETMEKGYELMIRSNVLFNIFINDLDAGLEGILSKFADDTKLGAGAVDSPSKAGRPCRETLTDQRARQSPTRAITNHMKFNKRKCWILHLGWGNPECLYRLGNEMLESSAKEMELGVLVNGKLNMSQQCPGSQEGQPCPGGHQAKHHCPVKEGIALLCSALGWPHLEYCVWFWAPQYKKISKVPVIICAFRAFGILQVTTAVQNSLLDEKIILAKGQKGLQFVLGLVALDIPPVAKVAKAHPKQTKLTEEGQGDKIQEKDLDWLEEWANRHCRKFSKDNGKP
ncbi:hypothetical protein WISP_96358 [Willisornis vidua]|uniref:Reverse transcriptase domain-containing protein n=1 Tax=Willisornis vidua TaxID=1566151 RepID=A0ABQ9D5P3_9PASS|nr:hypothetical protein WISP_96358 [Willisornis vidua]